MTPAQWKQRLEDGRYMRSRPGEQGQVSVYRHDDDGELRFDHIEWPDGSRTS